jgi:hypothetical protein
MKLTESLRARVRGEDLAMTAGKVESVEVTAPGFRAGIFIADGRCIAAGPALEWTLGKSIDELNAYFKRRGWRAVVRAPPPSLEAEQESDEDEDEEAEIDLDPRDRQLTLGV